MTTKRLLVCFVSIIVLLALLLPACAGGTKGPTPEAPLTIKMADIFKPGHPLNDGIMYFINVVEQRTNGAIKFEHYGAQQVVKGPDILDAVVDGTMQMGNSIYMSAKLPMLFIPQLPGAYEDKDERAVSLIWHDMVTDESKYWFKQMDGYGVRPLIGYVTNNYQVLTTEKPIRTLDDLAGVKMRVSGAVLPKTIEKLGATGVSMTTGDAYEALQRGIVDGASHPKATWGGLAYFELMKYATINFNLGATSCNYFISNSVWDSLPGDIQKIMTEAGREASAYTGQHYYEVGEADVVGKWKDAGIEVINLPAADQARVAQLIAPVKAEWIADFEAKGIPAGELVQDWEDQLKKAGLFLGG